MSAPAREKPTRAVALKYDQAEGRAPHVAATGSGTLAERILETAREHGVPIRQDPDLAEALAQLDLAQTIPVELYAVIAEVFAWAYRANSGYHR